MSKADDIASVLDDGRYKTETKIECIHNIIDDSDSLTFDEWCQIHDVFNERMYGGIQEEMTIEQAVEKLDSR